MQRHAHARRRRALRREGGFTLAELLVVMLIVGLLAAIAIPSFFAQRDKARDAAAKTSARTAATAIETFRSDNGGIYAGASVAILEAIEATLETADLTVVSADDDGYELRSGSPTGNTFTIERNPDGINELTCTSAGNAGCPSGGSWG